MHFCYLKKIISWPFKASIWKRVPCQNLQSWCVLRPRVCKQGQRRLIWSQHLGKAHPLIVCIDIHISSVQPWGLRPWSWESQSPVQSPSLIKKLFRPLPISQCSVAVTKRRRQPKAQTVHLSWGFESPMACSIASRRVAKPKHHAREDGEEWWSYLIIIAKKWEAEVHEKEREWRRGAGQRELPPITSLLQVDSTPPGFHHCP